MQAVLSRRKSGAGYPRQFWLLFWGVLFNRASVSILWPFLTVYMYQKLDVPLATVTLLMTARAVTSIGSTAVVSPIMDRFGRKRPMVWSLFAATAVFVAMSAADTIWAWLILLGLHGIVMPIFNNGVHAMVADIVPSEQRAPAYALVRMISNAGIAIGPVIGSTLALISFELIFLTTGFFYIILGVLVAVFIVETMPETLQSESTDHGAGYGTILKDRFFLVFCGIYLLVLMAYSQVFTLLPVYASENFGLMENEYSLFVTVNATMVVLLQYAVTRLTVRYRPQPVIVLGAIFYTVGLFSFVLDSSLLHFSISMAIITLGELIINPTAITLVANRAPIDMRARYLGILNLGYPVAAGIGPVIGGYLNDTVAPVAIWYGAGIMAASGLIGFFLLMRLTGQVERRESSTPVMTGETATGS